MPERVTILNRELRTPRNLAMATPEIEVFGWPDGTAVAFDINSLSALKVSPAAAEKLRSGKTLGLTGLLWRGVAPDYTPPDAVPVHKIVLNVTHGCNLMCKYCFAASHKRIPKMSIDTALRAVDLFRNSDAIRLWFMGGEPMLAWDLIVEVCERVSVLASRRGVRFHVGATTNGTRINNVKAAVMRRFGFNILLSLDGPEPLHNSMRPAKRGNSWRQTMRGLDALNEAGIRPDIRATFTDNPSMVERLEFFGKLYDEKRIRGASIEPATLSESCGTPNRTHPPGEEWHAAAEWFVARAKAGRPFPFYYFRKYLRRLLTCQTLASFCGAGRGYITVGPSGELYACHRETHTGIGNIETGFDDRRNAWVDNQMSQQADCMKCWARYLCGGGCRQARLELAGGMHKETATRCAVRRDIIREVMWIAANLTPAEAQAAAGLKPKGGQQRR